MKWTVSFARLIKFSFVSVGEQLVNHISNISCLTTKSGLVRSLQDHEQRLTSKGRLSRRLGVPRCFALQIVSVMCNSYIMIPFVG